ncbi:MAG: S8 family serine peptidase, partial [Gemmatimonadota bacterium]|nr:S8 family serine peptidase [Gemmatimonadota bacterium]
MKFGKARPKLDARLAYLASLPIRTLRRLKEEEEEALARIANDIAELREPKGKRDAERIEARRRQLVDRLFAPLTWGLYLPRTRSRRKTGENPAGLSEPYVSVFILSDASASDLRRLGGVVRCQACDVFTAFLPLSRLRRFEQSAAVRFIELSRPWFYDLNVATTIAQINTLHAAMPPVTGAGVIVGVIDNVFDVHHPDFQTAGQTRARFLWDQTLTPQGGEAGPPTAPALPGFTPALGGGATYGVEYNQATINGELTVVAGGQAAYGVVRHPTPLPAAFNASTGHGTVVTGCAAGNASGGGGFIGGAPGSTIIFVRPQGTPGVQLAADNVAALDAFTYIFARAAQAGLPCVVNMSAS